ncbi:Pyridine nucleotide-disulphide oxidoreductase [Oscillibacter sp. PC13]|uniref:NAD(P)/FAD-dependent oxidoreductase n=1 Tax=Oscillibacter sp. PC13 TaxID=1855299 RepID=UPI0008F28111|nr:FAD-dependent oxidoreductase [Oscillibacter sp. PC13]SFP63919.1 Pyridine nucleotide-disulphide oxidoreductase [Oscillibacter sp. PC13]
MNKIAIVGFGGAGYNAAKEARSVDPEAIIDVYSDTNIGPYNPMLTTYYVKGAIPYEALFPFGPLEEIAKELNLHFHGNQPVTGLEPSEKALIFADGSRKQYDNILISTGASAVMPPIPGLDLPGVFKMRTAADAVALKKMLEAGKVGSCLVIGASWVGIKVVEDMVAYRVPCTLVDGAKWMFYVAAFEKTAKRAQQDLEAKGVPVYCEQMLDHIEREENGQLTAVMQNGRRFSADTVAVCIGVRMNVGFLKGSGIEMNRGVLVDKTMRTNYEGIYAAGDCCEALDIQSGTHRNIGVWFNANKQGQVAGANMAGRHMEFDANVLVNLAHYLDYDFISIGDISACKPEDEVYEYEDHKYYIRAVKNSEGIKCINMIGSAGSNGVVKNAFIKAIESKHAGLDIKTICFLREKGFPDSFIDYLGGTSID